MQLAASPRLPAVRSRVQRRAAPRCAVASLASSEGVVVEQKTKLTFPRVLSGSQRCLGVGVRSKQLLGPIAVSVYAVALYADAAGLRTLLADDRSTDAAAALLAGDVPLTLCLVFARSVTAQQFLDALNAELASRSTDATTLESFSVFFRGKALDTGATVLLGRQATGALDVSLLAPQATVPPAPGASFSSPAFTRALFDVYLGERSIVPDAKAAWAAGARALL